MRLTENKKKHAAETQKNQRSWCNSSYANGIDCCNIVAGIVWQLSASVYGLSRDLKTNRLNERMFDARLDLKQGNSREASIRSPKIAVPLKCFVFSNVHFSERCVAEGQRLSSERSILPCNMRACLPVSHVWYANVCFLVRLWNEKEKPPKPTAAWHVWLCCLRLFHPQGFLMRRENQLWLNHTKHILSSLARKILSSL